MPSPYDSERDYVPPEGGVNYYDRNISDVDIYSTRRGGRMSLDDVENVDGGDVEDILDVEPRDEENPDAVDDDDAEDKDYDE